jgi:hypothetical protein
MSEAQHLAETLVAFFAYKDHGVLTPFVDAVAGLTAAQAARVPGLGLRSIWAIVNHVRFWHDVPLLQLRGLAVDWESLGAKDGWPPPEEPADEAAWQAAVQRTRSLNGETAALVGTFTDEELLEPVVAGQVTRWQVVQSLIAHNCYHTCSIITTRRLLGLWQDPI